MRYTFPTRWKTYRLDELGLVSRGRSRHRPRNDPSLYGGSYPFFQTGDVKSANLYLSEYSQTYNGVGLAQSKKWQPGTLCITIAANIAETAILKIHGCFPDSIIGFVADSKKADVLFIKYYIDFLKLDMQQISHGTTQDNLSADKLFRFHFIVPDIIEQKKITSILSAYDDLIENNLRRIKILEVMAQNLYREWFVKFRFPGHEYACFVDSPLGQIPEGWQVKTVGNTFTILGGGTPSKEVPEYWSEGMVNWYSPSNLTSETTMFMDESDIKINALGLKMSSARMFPPYSVMMTSRATIGVVSINTTAACTNQGFITCIPNENFPLYMLYFWIKQNVEYFISLGTGSTFKEIIKGVFKNIELIVPSEAIVSEYSAYVVPMANQVLNLQRRNTRLRGFRDILLPKLISGKIDVSELDITVPEEVHT